MRARARRDHQHENRQRDLRGNHGSRDVRAWRTVGAIITRVNNDVEQRVDRLEGLRRIGIDEISYKRGHRFLIVVVDHDTGHLVWAGPGRNDAALEVFFDELGDERAAQLTHVSADMADWIARVVAKRAPNAVRCADP